MSSHRSQLASPEQGAIDALLKMLRYLGMLGFLGGLAALSAMWLLGPMPDDVAQWRLAIGYMRPIFYGCVFSGIVILVVSGAISWWRYRHRFHAARWFKLMMGLLVIAVPTLHLSARATAVNLYAAVNEGHLALAAEYWNRLGLLFCAGFAVMLVIAAIGIFKPRLGQHDSS